MHRKPQNCTFGSSSSSSSSTVIALHPAFKVLLSLYVTSMPLCLVKYMEHSNYTVSSKVVTCNNEEGGVLVVQVEGHQQAGAHELHRDLHLSALPPHVQDRLLPSILLGGQVVESYALLLPVAAE